MSAKLSQKLHVLLNTIKFEEAGIEGAENLLQRFQDVILAAAISKGPLAIEQYLNNGCTNSLQPSCYLEENKKRIFLSPKNLYIDILILVELLIL